MTPRPRPRAALLDLDGTLLDTIDDLACAANRMLAAMGRAPLPAATIATFVGKGTATLVARCLAASGGADADALATAHARFDDAYREESGRSARLYPGVIGGLDALAAAGVALACVTNKPERFTRPLLAATGLAARFACVVSGDSVARGKPDPLPFVHACAALGVAPAQAVVIGDSENDALAGRAAGCRVLLVTYGYTEGKPVHAIACDGFVDSINAAARLVLRGDAAGDAADPR